MYDITQTYEPAFYMAGAFTTLAVCLLFLVPWLLPAEVKEEWRARSTGYRTRTRSTDSTVSSKISDDSPLASKSSNLGNEYGNKSFKEGKLCLQQNKTASRKFADSMEYILDVYLSMPKLISREDCVFSEMFSSLENVWELLGTSRETYV